MYFFRAAIAAILVLAVLAPTLLLTCVVSIFKRLFFDLITMNKALPFCISLMFAPTSWGQSVQPPVARPPVIDSSKRAESPPVAVAVAADTGKITEINSTLNNVTLLNGNGKSWLLSVRPQSVITVNGRIISKLTELKTGDMCAIRALSNVVERADCKRQ